MKNTLVILMLVFLPIATVYGELPKDVKADMYIIEAKNAMEINNYRKAVEAFQQIEGLGLSVPDNFSYFYGKALIKNNRFSEGRKKLEYYFTKVGRTGKHYQKALTLYSKSKDDEIKVKQEKAAQIRHEKERKAELVLKKEKEKRKEEERKKELKKERKNNLTKCFKEEEDRRREKRIDINREVKELYKERRIATQLNRPTMRILSAISSKRSEFEELKRIDYTERGKCYDKYR